MITKNESFKTFYTRFRSLKYIIRVKTGTIVTYKTKDILCYLIYRVG